MEFVSLQKETIIDYPIRFCSFAKKEDLWLEM